MLTKLEAVGQIVTWKSPPEVSISELRNALDAAGFDSTLAKDMQPRNAFTRAAKTLEDNRIIRRTGQTATHLSYQFTGEHLVNGEFEYNREALVELEKTTGIVTCAEVPALEPVIQSEVNKEIDRRRSSDVTRLIQKIFEDNAGDLMPLREGGGVYFVPETHKHLTDSVENVLVSLGGMVNRFQVASDGGSTDQSIAQTVKDHMEHLICEFRSTCEALNDESPDFVTARRFESINALRVKLSAYRDVLAGFSETIGSQLEDAEGFLRKQIGAEPAEPAEDDVLARIQAMLA